MADRSPDKNLKILMLACVPFFSPRGTPISIRLRLQDIASLGHKVDLVTYPLGEDVILPGLNIKRTMKIPFINDVPVGPSFKKLILDIFIIFKALGLLMRNRYDIIHTHEESSYFGAVFSKIFKVRHLYDFHSSLPQAMKNFGYGKYRKLISLLEYFEKHVVRSANGVITISKDLDSYVEGLNDNIPRVVIENFQNYDFKASGSETSESLKAFKSQMNGNKIVLYSGTFEHYQGLELLLDTAELLTTTRSNTTFVLAGGHQNQIEELRASSEKRGISDYVRFTGNLPFNELLQYMNASDVLISTRVIGNNPPLKIYDYLGAGKPIVATNINAHTQILNDDISVLVDKNPESISKGIESILDNPSYAKTLSTRSRKYFEDNYSTEDRLEKTRKFLDDVIKESI